MNDGLDIPLPTHTGLSSLFSLSLLFAFFASPLSLSLSPPQNPICRVVHASNIIINHHHRHHTHIHTNIHKHTVSLSLSLSLSAPYHIPSL